MSEKAKYDALKNDIDRLLDEEGMNEQERGILHNAFTDLSNDVYFGRVTMLLKQNLSPLEASNNISPQFLAFLSELSRKELTSAPS